jgi:hypothetical protein
MRSREPQGYDENVRRSAQRRSAPGKETAEGAEARKPGHDVDNEKERFRAYGHQLIAAHHRLLDMLDDVHEDLALHCLSFCEAVTRHHTAEDGTVFPMLSARHPELREFLASLERDHQIIAGMITRGLSTREDLDGLTAVLETHFIGEEKRLVAILNAIDPDPELTEAMHTGTPDGAGGSFHAGS